MRQILALSMLLVLVGCEDTVNIPKPSDSKHYFVCNELEIDSENKYGGYWQSNDDALRTLTINTKEKSIQVNSSFYKDSFTNTDQEVEASSVGGGGLIHEAKFNKVTGMLYEMGPFAGKRYKCRKVDKLMP